MGSFSIWHWIILLVIVLLLFGRGKIPQLMGDMAKGINSFKKGLKESAAEESTVETGKIEGGGGDAAAADSAPAASSIQARVIMSRLLGRSSIIHLSAPNPTGEDLHLHSRMPGKCLPGENEWIDIVLDLSQAFVFPVSAAK